MMLTIAGILVLCVTFLRFLVAMIAVTSGQRVTGSLRRLMPTIAAFYHIAAMAVIRTVVSSHEWKGRKV